MLDVVGVQPRSGSATGETALFSVAAVQGSPHPSVERARLAAMIVGVPLVFEQHGRTNVACPALGNFRGDPLAFKSLLAAPSRLVADLRDCLGIEVELEPTDVAPLGRGRLRGQNALCDLEQRIDAECAHAATLFDDRSACNLRTTDCLSPGFVATLVWVFVAARIAHTVTYALSIQPWRTLTYSVAAVTMLVAAVSLFWAGRWSKWRS